MTSFIFVAIGYFIAISKRLQESDLFWPFLSATVIIFVFTGEH